MRSYHDSIFKQANREFKLFYAKRAIRRSVKEPKQQHYTLCGDNLVFESRISEYSQKNGIIPQIFSFNSNIEEFQKASLEKIKNARRLRFVELYRENFSYDKIGQVEPVNDGLATIVDFDTCGWFVGDILSQSYDICFYSKMVFLTVIIKGRHTNENLIRYPSGMSKSDVQNPDKIGKWLETETPLFHLDSYVYENYGKKHSATMATIVMGRKSFAR